MLSREICATQFPDISRPHGVYGISGKRRTVLGVFIIKNRRINHGLAKRIDRKRNALMMR